MKGPSIPFHLAAESSESPRSRRPVLLINPNSGGGKSLRAGLADRARERGSKYSSCPTARVWWRRPVLQRRVVLTRLAWLVATDRWPQWPQWR